jgi:uncharacterized OB-fold protein
MLEAFEALAAPGPIPTALSRPFWEAARQKQLVLQHCAACESWVFYPRVRCPHCWSARLSWQPASGRGTVKTFSVVHRPGHPAWQAVAPYAVALIDLEEGVTMLSTLVEVPVEVIHIGMPVGVRFVRIGQYALPMFAPRERSWT